MTQITGAGRMLIAFSLLILLFAGLAYANPRERFAQETGLDLDLIGVLQVEDNGIEMTVTFVFINERTFNSKISAELRVALLPYIGRNAFYVNPSIEQVVAQSGFSPFGISVRQVGETLFTPDAEAWVDITFGFAAGRFEVNPSGPDQGSGSEGILVLDDAIDSTRPLDLIYRGQEARFEIGTVVAAPPAAYVAPSATGSRDSMDVAPLAGTGTLQGILMQDGFSDESMAALLDLDPNLVRVMLLTLRGEELRMLFVRLEEPVRNSALDPDLVSALDPLIGTGAVMVWAFTPTGAMFSPWHLYVDQETTWPLGLFSNPFIELTEGFSRSVILEPGEVVAGVFRLPGGVDSELPFEVHYGASSVTYP